jgi:hypothetical protein
VSLFFPDPETRSDNEGEWFALGEARPSSVAESQATRLGPLLATYRHLVDYISTLPADFYRVDGDKREQVTEPELIRNIRDEFGWISWSGQCVYGIASRGNAVGEATMFSGWHLPTLVKWVGGWTGGEDDFFRDDRGRAIPPRSLVHVPWLQPPGKRVALDPLQHFAAIVAAGISAQDYADVRRGGGIPPAVLKNAEKILDAEQATKVQSRAVKSFASGKPFVTGKDWDLTAMAVPPNHAMFIETLKLSANQIAAIYGIDPREIGGSASESLTYSNDESRALNRAQNANPYIVRFEDAVSRLLPNAIVMKLNTDARIRPDVKTRTAVIGEQIKDGRLSVNEARVLENRKPVDGGDFHNVPTPTRVEPTQRDKE